MLKQGEIYLVKLGERPVPNQEKYVHPIVCLEDADETDVDKMFHAVILSTKDTPSFSFINNEPLSFDLFEEKDDKNGYVVPVADNQHIIKIGLLKHAKNMPKRVAGKVKPEGICKIFKELLSIPTAFVEIEDFTIKEYVENLNTKLQ